MSNAPSQIISPGHRRFVGVVVTRNNIDPSTGINTPVTDTVSALTFPSNNHPEAVTPSVDPSNNRRVILTAGVLMGPEVGWTVSVSAVGNAGPVTQIPGKTLPVLDMNRVDWDGTEGDA